MAIVDRTFAVNISAVSIIYPKMIVLQSIIAFVPSGEVWRITYGCFTNWKIHVYKNRQTELFSDV